MKIYSMHSDFEKLRIMALPRDEDELKRENLWSALGAVLVLLALGFLCLIMLAAS